MAEIFNNRSVLSKNYLPETLIARDAEIDEVLWLLHPMLSRGDPKNALIYGKSGTGKTAVTRYALNEMNRRINAKQINIESVFINCGDTRTPPQILMQIMEKIAPELHVPKGLSTSHYYRQLWDVLNMQHTSLIVVFDEIDHLHDYNILYVLSRAGENQYLDFENTIGIIGLSNNLFFADRLEPRTISSLSPQNFVFPPYTADQLDRILTDRADIAFQPGVLTGGVLPLCAALSAQEHGDARKALSLLDNAGTMAERGNADTVTEFHVRAGYEKMTRDYIVDMVATLPLQPKLVLYSILRLAVVEEHPTTGQIETYYRSICEQAQFPTVSRTTISKLVSELETIGFIDAPIQNRGRRGRTRQITLQVDIKQVTATLHADPMFSMWA